MKIVKVYSESFIRLLLLLIIVKTRVFVGLTSILLLRILILHIDLAIAIVEVGGGFLLFQALGISRANEVCLHVVDPSLGVH